MSSLYRLYRPQRFEDVLGQEHICNSLTTALTKNKLGHAYLFAGPRGTGKTTLARLFARALNCTKRGDQANPCNACEICQEIAQSKATDVLEIDAASNRGIDEIRELREKIIFAPSRAAYKVYIIDEVHMLTREAFNALLKTLEEPPKHAVFVLATTELHKVPDTIVSRCQRYHFHRASDTVLSSLLKEVAKKEKIAIDEDGLSALVRRAEGSYRDALTLLGNLSTQGGGLDGTTVRKLLGLPSHEVVDRALSAIISGSTDNLSELLRDFIASGGDLVVLVKAMADHCKQEIIEEGGNMNIVQATTLLEQFSLALLRVRSSTDPQAVLLAQLFSVTLSNHHSASVSRVPATSPIVRDVQRVEKLKPEESSLVDTVVANPAPRAHVEPVGDDGKFWSRFLEEIKQHNHALYAVVRSAQLEGLSDESFVIAVKFKFYVDRLQEVRNKKLMESTATALLGRPVRLECVIRSDLHTDTDGSDDLMSAVVDVFELEEVK